MMSSLYAGVSGLRNHQTKMNVIGNNIANINTIGFKSGRVTFQESLVQTLKGAGRPSSISGGTNPVQMGLGMTVASVDTLFQQGGLETTSQITDMAIQGDGFFILSDGRGLSYTRAGAFGFDANSYLVDPGTGMKVQGRMAGADGVIPAISTVGDIRLPFGQQDPAHETGVLTLANNLNSAATDSVASLVAEGTTGIDQVSGTALNGAGGTHSVVLTGIQAVKSAFTGANGSGAMLGSMTLADMGVDDVTGLTITVDGTTTTPINGLTLQSTVNDVVRAINEIAGVDCRLDTTDPANVQIVVERTKAGENGTFNVTSSAGAATDATHGNIINRLFGLSGAGMASTGGLDNTFVAIDTFTPTGDAAEASVQLGIEVDDNSGMAVGITGLGTDGVTVKASNGLTAGNLVIDTAATQHSTSITSYDSQGGRHTLIVTFTKTSTDNLWDWNVTLPGSETILEGGSGTVRFNPDGSLLSFQYDGGANSLSFDPGNGAGTMNIQINAGDTGQFDGLTGFASPFTASAIQQDGYGMGILEEISVDSGGVITGMFSNGVSRTLAQVILAGFSNEGGLVRAGSNCYQVSANSGEAIQGVAGETISGSITSGALESSNVDIAQEFTSMITAQRGFQANSRIITTSDSMLEELVNLKR
ncbi:MAG: flagellar hook-basal body complex protein [candidate division Zixibacteria bacterium]|nr:flagellar hook-basal body complex protein [candidate division Zixibacteria bacterium]